MQFCCYMFISLFDRLCNHPIWILNNLVFIAILLVQNISVAIFNGNKWVVIDKYGNKSQTSSDYLLPPHIKSKPWLDAINLDLVI